MKWKRQLAVGAVLALALCACSSDLSTTTGSDGPTVVVDVGTARPIHMPQGKLKVGIFMNAQLNAWTQQVAKAAKAKAESYGWQATILDANFNVKTQIDQMQNAATMHDFDAWVVVPIDGAAVCKTMSDNAPNSNVVVVSVATVICGRDGNSGAENWQPGSYAFAGVGETIDYQRAWYAAVAKQYPGEQHVAVALGPDGNGFTTVSKKAAEEFAKSNPNFHLDGYIATDYTSPKSFTAAQAFLKAHPDTTLVLSVYSPDISRGVVRALKSLNLDGKVQMSDIGGSSFDVEQIKAGAIQLTMPYYPVTQGEQAVEAIHDAQSGATAKRIYDENPGGIGQAPVITSANLAEYKPQF